MAIPFMNFLMNSSSSLIETDPYFAAIELLLTGENGITTDSSTRQTTITNNGSSLVSGKFGSYGYDISSVSKYLSMNNGNFYFDTGDFTVEFWMYFQSSAAAAYGHILDTGGQGFAVAFGGSTSNILFYSNVGNADNVGYPHGMTNNTWNHVACVKSGTTCTIYINGIAGSRVWTGKTGSFSPSSGSVAYIGAYSGSPGSTYTPGCYIDDFRVTKGVARYTSDFSPPGQLPTTGPSPTTLLLDFEGSITDKSTYGTSLIVGSGVSLSTTKKYGSNGGFFDGSTYSNISVDNTVYTDLLSMTGDMTIEGWFNNTNLSGGNFGFFGNATAYGDSQLYLQFFTGNIYLQYGNVYANAASGMSSGTWYHIAVCRYGNTVKVFVNGSAIITETVTTNPILRNKFSVGDILSTGLIPWNGYIDDFRISKWARYRSNFTPPTQTLSI